jgi:hypothetical protein
MPLMTPEEALRFIQGAARVGQLTISRHRREDEHHVSIADQHSAIMSAPNAQWDDERENWELVGTSLDGETITVIVAIIGNRAHVVTAFGGRHHG